MLSIMLGNHPFRTTMFIQFFGGLSAIKSIADTKCFSINFHVSSIHIKDNGYILLISRGIGKITVILVIVNVICICECAQCAGSERYGEEHSCGVIVRKILQFYPLLKIRRNETNEGNCKEMTGKNEKILGLQGR